MQSVANEPRRQAARDSRPPQQRYLSDRPCRYHGPNPVRLAATGRCCHCSGNYARYYPIEPALARYYASNPAAERYHRDNSDLL